jgi:hypothetical protein
VEFLHAGGVVPISPEVAHLRAREANLTGRYGRDDPRVVDARRDRATASLAEHIKRVVDDFPPLTGEQRDRLAALLRPSTTTGAGAI